MFSLSRAAILLSVAFSSSSFADTDVYLTNNSGETLFIDVSHFGTDILQKGDEWLQHEVEVPPWTTREVLSFNRWQGVKAGKTYNFETLVSNQSGDTIKLHQQMRGSWHNSSIKHSVSADDKGLSWKDDRNIHRVSSDTFGDKRVELAYKADFTWRYDDLHYTVTPTSQDNAPTPTPEALSLMTYNIWALPAVASNISERFQLLPEYLKGYDVIALQEVFAGGRDSFLRDLATEYPYQTKMLNAPGANVHDGGVTIVSRYPIVNQAQFVYPDCSGTDCFADKGINYAEVIKNGEAYHVFATHAASFDTDAARENRQRQFKQMRAMAKSLNIPTNETVIYSGDLNVNKLKFEGDYKQMLSNLNASEPTYTGYTSGTFDPRINNYAGAAFSGGSHIEYLDYILLDNDYGQNQQIFNRVDVPRTTDSSVWGDWNLSDHQPVVSVVGN
ncbi:phospholipase [Veronia nyctiphanis]|uniref:Phospholipase n=1 Tax=Veronia nyctiphanis TaxID=1278244 RepID=A0A4V1LT80_9GAMM|nr:sphingomyelin phosphodiesterase [Veronia nyctiphanis]RXJ74268.1 phospholipase [Veronia nyctiphanis]